MYNLAKMLSEDYNENRQAEAARKQRAFTLRVSYTDSLTDKLNTALQFVVNKIGFIPAEKFAFVKGEANDLTLIDADGSILTINLQILETGPDTKNIIFHTDDCLRDYHKYIMSGVEFISRPEYNAAGLHVNFLDDQDNCYTLLEARTYTES